MFQRKPLRDDVQAEIQQRIVDGRLAAASRINETHLAAKLGLSRTPLREAMLTMAACGLLQTHMGRGFSVPALTAVTLREILEILRGLEPAALVMGGTPSSSNLMELDNLIQRCSLRFGTTDEPAAQARLVYRFSALALEHSPNATMREEIARLQSRAAAYWFAAGRRSQPGQDLLSSYREIYQFIRSGRIDEACRHWANHHERFTEPVVATFPATEGTDADGDFDGPDARHWSAGGS